MAPNATLTLPLPRSAVLNPARVNEACGWLAELACMVSPSEPVAPCPSTQLMIDLDRFCQRAVGAIE